MDESNNNHKGHFEAALPLPEGDSPNKSADPKNPAADLVRKKVQDAYTHEPSAKTEASDLSQVGSAAQGSPHQQFLYNLTQSGKSLAQIQADWHEYYIGLPDEQKHQVWQEFYNTHAQAAHHPAAHTQPHDKPQQHHKPVSHSTLSSQKAAPVESLIRTLADLRERLVNTKRATRKSQAADPTQSLLFGLGVGAAVVIIFLFGFFNERFIAPFIQPSRMVNNTPIISDNVASSADSEVIIPKINVEIPVVYGVNTIDEASVDNALESGVVHYADTAIPGQNGNVVIVGHSSNNIFNNGRYKFAFVLLSRLDVGDTFYLQKDGQRYTYQIYKKQIVKPTDVGVLGATDKPAAASLITCDPPGTSINRLVVIGQQINPNPSGNLASSITQSSSATKATIVPGNAPTLWSRLWKLLSR